MIKVEKVKAEIQGKQKGKRKKNVQDIDNTAFGISGNFFD